MGVMKHSAGSHMIITALPARSKCHAKTQTRSEFSEKVLRRRTEGSRISKQSVDACLRSVKMWQTPSVFRLPIALRHVDCIRIVFR